MIVSSFTRNPSAIAAATLHHRTMEVSPAHRLPSDERGQRGDRGQQMKLIGEPARRVGERRKHGVERCGKERDGGPRAFAPYEGAEHHRRDGRSIIESTWSGHALSPKVSNAAASYQTASGR